MSREAAELWSLELWGSELANLTEVGCLPGFCPTF